MKIFLSWSGDDSHSVACVLKEWLPSVIQSLRPYVSSQDIDKGARWSTDIAKELQESTFGILCITKSNIDAPWINFEAGALSKTVDKSLVAPFLFNIKRSEVQGPLLQFQSTINDKEDIRKLLLSINGAMTEGERLEEQPLNKSFEVWWPELLNSLAKIKQGEEHSKGHDRTAKNAQTESILEEILELTRNQQKLLRSPEELLPVAYLEYALRRTERPTRYTRQMISLLPRMQSILSKALSLSDRIGLDEDTETREMLRASMVELLALMAQLDFSTMRLEERVPLRSNARPISRDVIRENLINRIRNPLQNTSSSS